MSQQPRSFDIIIVGAGVVGSSLACALGDSGIQVALLEAQPLSDEWPEQSDSVSGFDARVSALTLASQHFLQQLDVWPLIASQRFASYHHMTVWDAEGTGSIEFDASDVNQAALGHIVENRIISIALLQRLAAFDNIHCLAPVKLETLESLPNDQGYALTLDNGQQFKAALVVAADGANSFIRRQQNFAVREWEYGHQAIVATVQTEQLHQHTAWQRFLPEGPLAFLPLITTNASQSNAKHYSSIVWSAIPQYAENLMALDDEEFCRQLGAAFEYRLGRIEAVGPRFSFPLRQRHSVEYIMPGLALVGDAAHSIHPLAGQGVNLGISDARVLSEELLRARERQLSYGSLSVLERYQRRRKTDNLIMMASMEGFKRLFANHALPVRWARNTGMKWLDKTLPLKRRVMRAAMGL